MSRSYVVEPVPISSCTESRVGIMNSAVSQFGQSTIGDIDLILSSEDMTLKPISLVVLMSYSSHVPIQATLNSTKLSA